MALSIDKITISKQMAKAINKYAGETLIGKDLIGKTIERGAENDGSIYLEESVRDTGTMTVRFTKTFNKDGNIHSSTYYHKKNGGCDNSNPAPYADGIVTEADKAAVIIAALFGVEEVGSPLTDPQKAAVRSLELAITKPKNK